MPTWRILAVGLATATSIVAVSSSAHDFQETRRLVLSVERDHVDLLVAYEVRPGRVADSLRARFDADRDGRATTPLERIARAQVVGPRLRQGLRVDAGGRRLRWSVQQLTYPDPPIERGRVGVGAMALFRAPLPEGADQLRIRALDLRGGATIEAQSAAGIALRCGDLTRRPGDPVLGPAPLRPGTTLTISIDR